MYKLTKRSKLKPLIIVFLFQPEKSFGEDLKWRRI